PESRWRGGTPQGALASGRVPAKIRAMASKSIPGSTGEQDETSLTGQVLIAMPSMGDSRFAHSVIYVCAHTNEGAMGIVVNSPLESPSFSDLLKQLKVD